MGVTADAGRVDERIELVEVARVREDEQGDVDAAGHRLAAVVERVLLGQGVAAHRHDGDGRDAGPLLEQLHGVAKERRVAAELVQDKAADERALLGLEELPGPQQVRERAAPIDVGDEVDVCLALQRDRHVHDVAGAQIDLRWAAGAFDDDLVEFLDQTVERGLDDRPQARIGARATAARSWPRRSGP